jgi:UDP-N-acetylmuramate dehydrogenase
MESFRGAPRYVVLEVTFQFKPADLSMPVAYTELASALGIEVGGRAPLSDVRQMVLRLRTAKGMLLDPQDHDTWSSGSFFTNPVLTDGQAADLPEEAPRWPAGDGLVKTSAAWLIERAGFARGFGLPGPAALSGKHALAVTNRGEARAADILVVVRAVRDGVRARFGVELAPETVLVGCDL